MGKKQFLAAMYLRLSKEDAGAGRAESNSIGNQRELIKDFIHGRQDIELYDIYVDDGFSGSNFDRPEFKRMISDIGSGKVNCVIVKDLSRFGRDYIESGRYIQKIFPALSVRFIAVTDHYDSIKADVSESGIILPVKNFINDSYCRDISAKVKSQFGVKRKNGECIAPFAPYGYKKAENNKNLLVPDEYASDIVRKIFAWKTDGMAVSAIAAKLNGLGILSPKEYKKSLGLNYKGGFSGAVTSKWSSSTVKRILTDETYLGHMVQGKREKINYKLKKIVDKPKGEWIKVENTHEASVSKEQFLIVQNLLGTDSRISPATKKNSMFSGILFCGDCGEQMVRRINRYKGSQKVYYICSTKNRGDGCSRHSIQEELLKEMVWVLIRHYADCFMEEKRIFGKTSELEADFGQIARHGGEIARLQEQQDKYYHLCSCLYRDLRQGIITDEEYQRLHGVFGRKAAEFGEALKRQESMGEEMFKKGIISAKRLKEMQECPELKEIDRQTLCSMVKKVTVFEGNRLEIEFRYTDRYHAAGRSA